MNARHLILPILAVVLAVIGTRSFIANDSSTSDKRTVVPHDDTQIGDPTPRVAPTSPSRQPPATSATDTVIAAPPPTIGTATETTDTSTPGVELVDLVDAARPSMDVVEIVDDGHHHPTHGTHSTTVGATAVDVVAAVWTWRFDDQDGRLRTRLDGVVTESLIDRLAPTPHQQIERVEAGEVSWVIVRDITVDGPTARVVFDQHLVALTTAETITERSVAVAVVAGLAIEVNE